MEKVKKTSKEVDDKMVLHFERKGRSNSIVQRRRMSLVHQHLEELHGYINNVFHTLSGALPLVEEDGQVPVPGDAHSVDGSSLEKTKLENKKVFQRKMFVDENRIGKCFKDPAKKKVNVAEEGKIFKKNIYKGKDSRKENTTINKGVAGINISCKTKCGVCPDKIHNMRKEACASDETIDVEVSDVTGCDTEEDKASVTSEAGTKMMVGSKTVKERLEESAGEMEHESEDVDLPLLMCELQGISTSTTSLKESISVITCIEIELRKLFEEKRPWVDEWQPGIFSEVTKEMDNRLAETSRLLESLIDVINKKDERANRIERQLARSHEDAAEVLNFRQSMSAVVAQCAKLNDKLQSITIHRAHG